MALFSNKWFSSDNSASVLTFAMQAWLLTPKGVTMSTRPLNPLCSIVTVKVSTRENSSQNEAIIARVPFLLLMWLVLPVLLMTLWS